MANPNRTSYTGPTLAGPGLIFAASTPNPPLTLSDFHKWYQTIHIPDIMKAKSSGGCVGAFRFKSLDPSCLRPYLALYKIDSMEFIQRKEFRNVNQYDDLSPEGGPSQKFIDFDTRFYRQIQVYEPSINGISFGEEEDDEFRAFDNRSQDVQTHGRVGVGKVIKCTSIQPANGAERNVDEWYRNEHLQQVSQMPGYIRSTRYELIFKVQSLDDTQKEEAPKYLAIHEFAKGTVVNRIPRENWTKWTQEVVKNAEILEEGVYEFLWGKGDIGLRDFSGACELNV